MGRVARDRKEYPRQRLSSRSKLTADRCRQVERRLQSPSQVEMMELRIVLSRLTPEELAFHSKSNEPSASSLQDGNHSRGEFSAPYINELEDEVTEMSDEDESSENDRHREDIQHFQSDRNALRFRPRVVRIGSYKTRVLGDVVVDAKGISFPVERVKKNKNDAMNSVTLRLRTEDINGIWAYSGREGGRPILVVYASRKSARNIRRTLNMSRSGTSRNGPFFCPSSKDERQRRILITVDIRDAEWVFPMLKNLWKDVKRNRTGKPVYHEISRDEAFCINFQARTSCSVLAGEPDQMIEVVDLEEEVGQDSPGTNGGEVTRPQPNASSAVEPAVVGCSDQSVPSCEQDQSQIEDLSAEEELELEEACQIAELMYTQPQVAEDNLDWEDNVEIDDAALIEACEEGEKKAVESSNLGLTLAEDLICCICTDLLHECVSIFPCTHCFCGSCLSKWVYEQGKLSCPKCRGPLDPGNVRPFPQIVCMVERLLEKQPGLQARTKDELDEMSRTNRFKHVNTSGGVSTAPALSLPAERHANAAGSSSSSTNQEVVHVGTTSRQQQQPWSPHSFDGPEVIYLGTWLPANVIYW